MTEGPAKRFCPRCKGQLLADDGEAACLQCGYREELRMTEPEQRDAFQQLVEALQKTAAHLQAELGRAEKRLPAMREQVRRVECALEALTKPTPPRKAQKARTWTPEQRAAQSERMRGQNSRRREQAA